MYRMVVLAKLNTLVKQWIIDISLSKVSLIVINYVKSWTFFCTLKYHKSLGLIDRFY